MTFNPDTDLQIERLMKARPETLWRCWEEPDLFRQWFTPGEVEVSACDLDLRAGGRFYTQMRLPDGTVMDNDGVFLLVERHRRMVSTDSHTAGFRPAGTPFMTVDATLTPVDGGTLYHAHIMHIDSASRQQHVDMGFEGGWGTTFRQLEELAQSLE